MRKNQFRAGCGEIRRKFMGKAAGKPYNKVAKGFFSCECDFLFFWRIGKYATPYIIQLGDCELFVVSDSKTSQMQCILTVETVETRRPISRQEVP